MGRGSVGGGDGEAMERGNGGRSSRRGLTGRGDRERRDG